MALAIGMFLVILPGALVVMAARPPSEASLRRLAVTVLGDCSSAPSGALIAARLRRCRALGAAGAVVGLWLTASWDSATWTWNGVLSSTSPSTSGIAPGVGRVTLAGGSFALALNVFGVLAGFGVGLLAGEWAGGTSAERSRRSASLTPRDSGKYLAGWLRVALVVVAASAIAALAVATIAPNSHDSLTYEAGSPWWAVLLVGLAVAALATRVAVLASAPHAATGDQLAAREVTRALTAATLTTVALAGFTGSTASSLARLSGFYGWGWGDGTATGAISFWLVTTGLVVAAFLTPYWALAVDVDAEAPVGAA